MPVKVFRDAPGVGVFNDLKRVGQHHVCRRQARQVFTAITVINPDVVEVE